MRRDETTLLDIAEAARLVVSFAQDMSKAVFLDDYKTQSAVLYQLIVMGAITSSMAATSSIGTKCGRPPQAMSPICSRSWSLYCRDEALPFSGERPATLRKEKAQAQLSLRFLDGWNKLGVRCCPTCLIGFGCTVARLGEP